MNTKRNTNILSNKSFLIPRRTAGDAVIYAFDCATINPISISDEDYEELDYSSPEEDMEKVSDELLKKDDVYYESKHHQQQTSDTLFEDFL